MVLKSLAVSHRSLYVCLLLNLLLLPEDMQEEDKPATGEEEEDLEHGETFLEKGHPVGFVCLRV